jgi:asparagine synthase (glutamine-hydrolysing)
MSGIAGIFHLDDRSVDRAQLAHMVDRLAHRGPDGADIWCEGAIGLGHRMLWTTPESLFEKLPHVKAPLSITADARIDNREELVTTLELNNYPIKEATDSDIILAAYEKWGEECPKHLLGDFAFAIWDGFNQCLFCARDQYGIKPFYYYHHSGKSFVFASEIKGLLASSDIPRHLNESRVGDFLLLDFEETSQTLYQDIFRLPPATRLIVNRHHIQSNSYWSLDPTREIRLQSNEEYAEAFRDVFTKAVHCRLRSAFSIGSTLSGGLDSSSISCVARNFLVANGKDPLHTFSWIFEKYPTSDERHYQGLVVAQGGIQPHQIQGDRISPLVDFETMLWHLDEPHNHPNFFLLWELFKATQGQQIRVLLEGLDGDTTVSHGLGYFNELAQQGRIFTLLRETQGYTQIYGGSAQGLIKQLIWTQHITRRIHQSQFFFALRRRWHNLRKLSFPSIAWLDALNPAFVKRLQLRERLQDRDRLWIPKTEREMHHKLLQRGRISYHFEGLNKIGAAFNVEPRYPFSDIRVLEFCLALPPEQKMYQGCTRMVLRRAMQDILPPEIQWRLTKGNLSPNFDQGLPTYEHQRLQKFVSQDVQIIEPFIHREALQAAFQRLEGATATNHDLDLLWHGLILALWLERAELVP